MLIIRAMFKQVLPKHFYLYLLTGLIVTTLRAVEPPKGRPDTDIFTTTDNSVKKCELLFSLKKHLPKNDEKIPSWITELLNSALNDKNPVVVAEAIYQIGEFRCTAFGQRLLTVYRDAGSKFRACGYTERVRNSIIPALGKIGGKEAKTFIAELLKKETGSYISRFLLTAIKDLNDTAFIDDLQQYKARLEKYVVRAKEKGHDPLFYSEQQSYISSATEIVRSLGMEGNK